MSFVISLYVREGIVMASDSRLTLKTQSQQAQNTIVQVAVGQSDSNYKTFLAQGNIGISTFGAADIQGVPIAGYIESFIDKDISSNQISINDAAKKILAFFGSLSPQPKTQFHVAGYRKEDKEQEIWMVDIAKNQISLLNKPGTQGASWGGEGDILARLVSPVAELDEHGKPFRQPPHFQIPWPFFTLQDAIDFAVFAVRSTIDAIRFQPRAKTVGGPIDVLVLKPDNAFWVSRKELKV